MNLGKMNKKKEGQLLGQLVHWMKSQFFFTATYSVLFSSETKLFGRLNEKYFYENNDWKSLLETIDCSKNKLTDRKTNQ